MAVMSFAHLKNRKTPETMPETPASSSGLAVPPATSKTVVRNDVPTTTGRPGVLGFAHLKNKTVKETAQPVITPSIQGVPSEIAQSSPVVVYTPARSTYRIPAVMPTARLQAVNYCHGCSRFLPASDWEKQHGDPYGRCLREERPEGEVKWQVVEVWKVIPASAPVYRCWYFINRKQ